MAKSKIEWCDRTWNPITGCPGPSVSLGCGNCYARRTAETRLRGRCGYDATDPFKITFHPDRLKEPAEWKAPQRIFVGSMGDMFHEDIADHHWEYLERVFLEFAKYPQHTFMLLTKRPKVARWWFNDGIDLGALHPNVWLGVTVCNQDEADEKIPVLLQTSAAKHFVSIEPMLGSIDLCRIRYDVAQESWVHDALTGKVSCANASDGAFSDWSDPDADIRLDWVICGGETGKYARPVHPSWVRNLREQCQQAGVPFFFKGWGDWCPFHPGQGYKVSPGMQTLWGTINREGIFWRETTPWSGDNGDFEFSVMKIGKKRAGRLLDGREWHEMPQTHFESTLPF